MPLVSVIIPAYNSGPYLDEAVRSVIAQTFTDWECIVVDDGSTEDLSRIGNMDARVRLIRQTNKGPSAARNNGVLCAGGELIALLDHDDLWLPAKLEAQISAMRQAPNSFCYCAFSIVDKSGCVTGEGWSTAHHDYYEILGQDGPPLNSALVFNKRSAVSVGLFDPLLPSMQDYDFVLRLARSDRPIFLEAPLMRYRLHGANLSQNYIRGYAEARSILNRHIAYAECTSDQRAVAAAEQMLRSFRRTFGTQAYDAARRSARERDLRSLFRHLMRAAVWNPSYLVGALVKFPFQQVAKRRRREFSSRDSALDK